MRTVTVYAYRWEASGFMRGAHHIRRHLLCVGWFFGLMAIGLQLPWGLRGFITHRDKSISDSVLDAFPRASLMWLSRWAAEMELPAFEKCSL